MTTLEDLKHSALSGRINRRNFIKESAALGLTVAAASTLADSVALAAEPNSGGNYRVALDDGNTTDSFDPATYEGSFQIGQARVCGNYLTEITSDNVAGPDLAESWEASPDASSWTFKLRQGVEFHNGKTLSANDVVASLNHHRGPDSTSGGSALLDNVIDIVAVDANTVRIDLTSGSADMPYVMTDYHMLILPADGEGNLDTSGIGTGGYVMESFEPGIGSYFHRNPNYFKEGKANFDSVEYHAVADANARESGLVSGEFESIISVDTKTVDFLAQNPGVRVDEVASGAHATLAMHVDIAPYDDNNVRMALKYAMDRQSAVDVVLRGHGTIGNDHPVAPTMPYYDADQTQRMYDPDKAMWHLKQAGLDSLSVPFSTSDVPFPGGVDFSVLYQEKAKAANIDLDVVRESADGYWSNVWLVQPFSLVAWGARPTPDMILSLAYAGGAAWNETHLDNARLNTILVEARAELDDAKRGEMYAEAQMIVSDEGGTIVPFFTNYLFASTPNLLRANEGFSGDWTLDGYRSAERWWYEEGTI
ncbi:MAG: ABC transporter substrate-binding protein [Alphaproteobacteria bacterium]|nr:ABC transporter substrate-binding protein [Alphaproteobacteria bacterium]